jgi:rubrerythrin
LAGVALGLGILNLIINIILIRKVRFHDFNLKNQTGQTLPREGLVICKKCNYKYASTLQKCPSCGSKR